jgi:hypothetical protein
MKLAVLVQVNDSIFNVLPEGPGRLSAVKGKRTNILAPRQLSQDGAPQHSGGSRHYDAMDGHRRARSVTMDSFRANKFPDRFDHVVEHRLGKAGVNAEKDRFVHDPICAGEIPNGTETLGAILL